MNSKNPIRAPATAQVTGSIPEEHPMATTEKNTATIRVTLPARPSRPSVKFVPLAVPSVTKNRMGTFQTPKSRYLSGKKGTLMARLTSVYRVRYQTKMPVTSSCPDSFCKGVSPRERLHTTFM